MPHTSPLPPHFPLTTRRPHTPGSPPLRATNRPSSPNRWTNTLYSSPTSPAPPIIPAVRRLNLCSYGTRAVVGNSIRLSTAWPPSSSKGSRSPVVRRYIPTSSPYSPLGVRRSTEISYHLLSPRPPAMRRWGRLPPKEGDPSVPRCGCSRR